MSLSLQDVKSVDKTKNQDVCPLKSGRIATLLILCILVEKYERPQLCIILCTYYLTSECKRRQELF